MKTTNVIFLTLLSVVMCSCKWLTAGSYPFVESYSIPLDKNVVVDVITKFKEDNPQLNLPDSVYNGDFLLDLKDGHKCDDGQSGDHWYFFRFYDKKNDQIITTWVRKSGKNINETSFALVSIKKDARTGKWQRVNDDLKGKENKEAIARFEELILEPIKKRLQPYLPEDKKCNTKIAGIN